MNTDYNCKNIGEIMKDLFKALSIVVLVCITPFTMAKQPLKVGFIYVSPIGEAGWTYSHNEARKYVAEKFGDAISTTYVESVPEGADAERILMKLAKSGHDLIFTTSFGYMNATIKVAKRFPKIKFEHAAGYKRAKNVSTYLGRIYESRYLSGVAAGYKTESNIVGFIGAFPIPEVIRSINAFTLGVRSVKPDANVKVIWVNTWFDPAKEREAVMSLVDQKADVITFHTDSPSTIQAAQESGVSAVGYHSDMSAYGKKAHLTAATHHWEQYYEERIQALINGTWRSTDTWGGIGDGMTDITAINPVISEQAIEKIQSLKSSIAKGDYHPFTGPLKNQAGQLVLAEGEIMDDKALLKMDFYVEGVLGKLK
jgi:simple sugar transport system substrate-binding protein